MNHLLRELEAAGAEFPQTGNLGRYADRTLLAFLRFPVTPEQRQELVRTLPGIFEQILPAIKVAEEKSYVLTVIGDRLRLLGFLQEALDYLGRAAEAAETLDSALTRCNAFRSYGNLLSNTGRYPEAAEYLRRAAEAAETLDDALTRCNAARSLAHSSYRQKNFKEALPHFVKSQRALHQTLRDNRWPQGVGAIVSMYADVFHMGLWTADRVYEETQDELALWHGLGFADGIRCVLIREGLRQHAARPSASAAAAPWRPGPERFRELFHEGAAAGPAVGALRGLRRLEEIRPADYTIRERSGVADPDKDAFCPPIAREELDRLLPDDDTVLVLFHFVDDDLYGLPIRRGEDRKPRLIHGADGFLFLTGVRPRLEQLVKDLRNVLAVVIDPDIGWYRLDAAELRKNLRQETVRGGHDTAAIFEELGAIMAWSALLEAIEPDPARRRNLHLVLLPDGPLFQLPLHAARVEGRPLVDCVGSLRYGLSLRTLAIQEGIERSRKAREEGERTLRGVAFVNPAGGDYDRLHSAVDEVAHLVNGSPPESWRLFGERGAADLLAVRANLRRHHPTPNLLWSVCHGGTTTDTIDGDDGPTVVVNPSLLLRDGPVSTTRMVAEGYDLKPVLEWHNSCCLLGRIEERERTHQVEGYIAALTLLGCRRVSSASWELSDVAAAEFARHKLKALCDHVFRPGPRSPHAFALAHRDAIAAFRAADDRRYDHEYFWAPYLLYGLG